MCNSIIDHWDSCSDRVYPGHCGPVQQPHPSRTGGLHRGLCGSCHWTVNGLQLWLRRQPCQRPGTTSFHCYGRLGRRGLHVSLPCNVLLCFSVLLHGYSRPHCQNITISAVFVYSSNPFFIHPDSVVHSYIHDLFTLNLIPR